jgi:hypothetical protein
MLLIVFSVGPGARELRIQAVESIRVIRFRTDPWSKSGEQKTFYFTSLATSTRDGDSGHRQENPINSSSGL